jgi:hypothetical protein
MVDRRGAIAEHDRAHLKESETEKLARSRREAEEVEQRARQQLNAERSEDWQRWFKGSFYAELMSGKKSSHRRAGRRDRDRTSSSA